MIDQWRISRRLLLGGTAAFAACPTFASSSNISAPQPFFENVRRALKALEDAGQPVSAVDTATIEALAAQADRQAIIAAQAILDRYTLVQLTFDSGGIGSAALGGAERVLVEQGWRSFLIRIGGANDTERVLSVFLRPITRHSQGENKASVGDLNKAPGIEKAWLYYELADATPLSRIGTQYRVVDLLSRDRGKRSAKFAFEGSNAPFGFFSSPALEFDCLPAREVNLSIKDSDGIGCMASLVIKDPRGRIYPAQVRRIAPDFSFQPQIYRADGENLRLPDGEYDVSDWRGPEYIRQSQRVRISGDGQTVAINLRRWVDPAKWGWYSGDVHIHVVGCSHYVAPTEGVTPETMIRHVRGEGLAVGSALNWGPSWYYQKQFFSGSTLSPDATLEHPELQAANNQTLRPKPTPKDKESLLRYDVEVSGFPSSSSGHLILLQLKEQDYPGTKAIEDWPSYTLPILEWAKRQGAIVGYAHCSMGMQTASSVIPNYEIPPFDSIGTNAAIVDITHDACDFLSGCQGQPASELNAWYHLLNCGFRLAMVGETDWPCIHDDRVGMGRTYVKLDQRPTDDPGFAEWLNGIRSGRLYCGDGRSHFLEFAVNGRRQGTGDLGLRGPGAVTVTATIAARIEEEPITDIRTARNVHPAWHLEYARLGTSRAVPIELVVNGQPRERIEFVADGKPRQVSFKTRIDRSSWLALRILPSGHTYPIFVSVADKPIRASRRSAEWLRQCVDALWQEKHRLIRESERAAAAEAYDHARRRYDRIIAESDLQ